MTTQAVQSIENVVDFFLNANRCVARQYGSEEGIRARIEHAVLCPRTALASALCMDGRVKLKNWFGLPDGVSESWRDRGGNLRLGKKFFSRTLVDWVNRSAAQQKQCVFFATYHFSRSCEHHGCAAFNYDRDAAYNNAVALKAEIDYVFSASGKIKALVFGMETDRQFFILHSFDGEICLDLSTLNRKSPPEEIFEIVSPLYPGLDACILRELSLLFKRHLNRPEINEQFLACGAEHQERAICYGRGFDWIPLNSGLIVGPWDNNQALSLELAARVILSNMRAGKIPGDEVAFVCQAPYYHPGEGNMNILLAKLHARELFNFGMDVLRAGVPEIVPFLRPIVGTIDMGTMQFDPIYL